MENKKKLFREFKDKNVDKSTTDTKIESRIESYERKLIRVLGNECRPEVLPFRKNADKIQRILENKGIVGGTETRSQAKHSDSFFQA